MSDTNELVKRLTEIANRDEAKTVTIRTDDLRAVLAALAPVEEVPVVKPTHQADALEIAQRWAIWIADNIEGEDDEYGSLRSSFERDKATLFAALASPPAQAGAVTEAMNQLVLIHSLANDITEHNYADKRLYILQTCVRLCDTLTAALGAQTPEGAVTDSRDDIADAVRVRFRLERTHSQEGEDQ